MSYTMTEKAVLDKLGISSFRELSKENVIEFATMIPFMDKEVALKTIEQIPNFANLCVTGLTDLKDIGVESLKSNSKELEMFKETCDREISILESILEEEMPISDKLQILDKIADVKYELSAQIEKSQQFKLNIFHTTVKAVTGVVVVVAGVLGLKGTAKKNLLD